MLNVNIDAIIVHNDNDNNDNKFTVIVKNLLYICEKHRLDKFEKDIDNKCKKNIILFENQILTLFVKINFLFTRCDYATYLCALFHHNKKEPNTNLPLLSINISVCMLL